MRPLARSGISAVFFTLFLTGCGQQWVTDINVETYGDPGASPHAKVTTTLQMNGMVLPGITFPILHPQTGAVVGTIGMGPSSAHPGQHDVSIDVDIKNIAGISGCEGGAVLPNGQQLPLGAAERESIVCLPVGGAKIRIFLKLNLQANSALVGTAIPIAPMDKLGGSTGVSSFFHTFLIENKIPGTFGLFMGPQPGQNGLAFFFQLDELLPKDGLGGILAVRDAPEAASAAEFLEVTPSQSNQLKTWKYLQKLSKDRAFLSLQ